MTWDKTIPADTEALSLGASRIRETRTDIETALQTEGVFPGAAPATPVFRYKPRRGDTASRPANDATNPGTLYLNTDTGSLQRDNGTTWDDVTYPTAGAVALHQPVAKAITSASGVVTLDETTNSFVVDGTEDITSITGWSAGVTMIRWNTVRKIVNAAGLILPGYSTAVPDRYTLAGDISWFEFFGAGQVREVNFRGIFGNEIPGSFRYFPVDVAPRGWLACDGSSFTRTDKPGLFAVIGTKHGAPSALTFRVPDIRGRFIRGIDDGAGNDPDAATRTAPQPGDATDTGQSGDNAGSVQADKIADHDHNQTSSGAQVGGTTFLQTITADPGTVTGESRPKNLYLLPCIKE